MPKEFKPNDKVTFDPTWLALHGWGYGLRDNNPIAVVMEAPYQGSQKVRIDVSNQVLYAPVAKLRLYQEACHAY